MSADKTKTEFNTQAGAASQVPIALFHATQLKFGFREIEEKKKRFQEMAAAGKLEKYLQKNPVIVVLGPPGIHDKHPFPRIAEVAQQIAQEDGDKDSTKKSEKESSKEPSVFVIDRHHESLALMLGGFKTAPIQVVHDFSKMTPGEFWHKMHSMHLLYNNADNGEPESYNDIYRSLAWYARKAGGFNKVDVPYTEFKWADYFRSRIDKELITNSFETALQKALELARLPEAQYLPGYIDPAPEQANIVSFKSVKSMKASAKKASKSVKSPAK